MKNNRILAVSYGDKRFTQALGFNLWTAKHIGGATAVKKYTPESIDEIFIKEHDDVLSAERGAGYWLWKAWVVNDALKHVEYGDYLVYADAGSFYARNIKWLIKQMENHNQTIFLGKAIGLEANYTKRDAFVLLDADTFGFEKQPQVEAAFILLKKTQETEEIIANWLRYGCDRRIISDDENVCGLPNYEGFIEHRFDQSILSLLYKKSKGYIFRNPNISDYLFTGIEPLTIFKKGSYYSEVSSDNFKKDIITAWKSKDSVYYPQIIIRTRFRNSNLFLFYCKVSIRILRYLYRNQLSLFITWIYYLIMRTKIDSQITK